MAKHFFSLRPFILGAVSLLFLGFVSCNKSGGQQAEQAPPPEVDFMVATAQSGTIENRYPGTIEGIVNVDIRPQVSGYLEAIFVKEGDFVKKGQLLFKVRDEIFREQSNTSKAAYQNALANMEKARLEVEKIKPLVEGKVFSQVQLRTAESDYAAAKAQVAQSLAAYKSAKLNADFSEIKAPVSGYIGRIPNRVGNLVSASDQLPLTTLSEIDSVYVYFSISEADYLTLTNTQGLGATAGLILANGAVYEHTGRLESASGNIDRTTASLSMKAVFTNPRKLLRSGGSAQVVLATGLDNVIRIPMASVVDLQDKHFVYLLTKDNTVTMAPVVIAGNSASDYFVSSGIKPGDKIAVNNLEAIGEGLPVQPKILKAEKK